MAKWHYEAKWSILNGVLTISENSHIVRVTMACCDHGCTEFHLGNIGLYDAVTLVDDILNHVDSEYPFFPHRLLKNSRQEQSAPRSDKKTEIPQPSPAAKGGDTEVE